MQLHRQVLQALAAQAVAIALLYICPLLCRKHYTITLALRYITRLAFKGLLAAGAVLYFMLAHIHLVYNCTLMPPVRRKGIELYPRMS